MKNLIQHSKSLIVYTFLISGFMLSFLFPKPRHGPISECSSSVQKEIIYSFNEVKIKHGKTLTDQFKSHNPTTTKGLLELCLSNQGDCTWKISEGKTLILAYDISEMGTLMRFFQKEVMGKEVDYQDFIESSIQEGAKVTNLNNNTLSIRLEDRTKKIKSVTLIDIKRNQLLGCSVYNNNGDLQSKLVCKYGNDKNRIQETQLIYSEKQGTYQVFSEITSKHF